VVVAAALHSEDVDWASSVCKHLASHRHLNVRGMRFSGSAISLTTDTGWLDLLYIVKITMRRGSRHCRPMSGAQRFSFTQLTALAPFPADR
jgi:hypothetical protein